MKHFFIAFALSFFFYIAHAQNSSIRQKINYKFAPLKNSTYLTTGYLYDKSVPDVDGTKFNGIVNTTDTNSASQMRQLIWQQQNAYMPVNKDASVELLKVDSIVHIYTVQNQHPIAVQLAKYNRLKPYALDSNLVGYNTDSQLVEIPSITQSPFEQFTVYAASTLFDHTTLDTLKFIIPSSLIYNNTGFSITALQINFGSGYSTITPDNFIKIIITEATNFNCTLKISLSDGNTYYNKFSFGKRERLPLDSADGKLEVTADILYVKPACATINTGSYAKARYYTKYAYTNTDNKIHKPVIFIEGFDPKIADDLPFRRYGDFGWDVFSSGGKNARSGDNDYPNIAYMPTALTTLLSAPNGYDVVLVDFENGGDYIQKNAYALIKIIQEINSNKVGTEELVIVGTSMGGLISRYALKYMEDHNMPHCCRLWVSYDSPQNGANIPIGLQAALGFFANFKESAALNLSYLNTPAALQMLLRHRGYTKDYEDLNPDCYKLDINYGFPEKLRKIALLNGNITQQNQGYGHTTEICDWRYDNLFHTRLQCQILSQPQNSGNIFSGAYSKIGFISLTTFSLVQPYNCNGTCQNYDGAPGSYHQAIKTLYNQINDGAAKQGVSPTHAVLNFDGRACFIPSTSALAIYPSVSTDVFYDIKTNILFPQITLQLITPFESYYATGVKAGTTSINEAHVHPTNENTTWLIEQMVKNEYNLGAGIPFSGKSTYNFASYHRRSINAATINNGGLLQLNGNYKSDWGTTNDDNAISGSLIKFRSNECNSANITIANGGKLYIGDNVPTANNNKAYLYLSTGTVLRIKNNGELKIYAGSKLIIENGAKIIIEPGAIITLPDEGGGIEIEGQLELLTNAVFKPSGSGYVKFLNNSTNQATLINAHGNNTIEFEGPNATGTQPVTLKVAVGGNVSPANGFIVIPSDVVSFKITNTSVQFDQFLGLDLQAGNINITNSTLDKTATATLTAGLKVNGSSQINFNNVTINNATTGIDGLLNISGSSWNTINLFQVYFSNCTTAIHTIGGNLQWSYGNAASCTQVWQAFAAEGISALDNLYLHNSTVSEQVGIEYHGANNNSTLNVSLCNVQGFGEGIDVYTTTLNLKCSNLQSCTYAGLFISDANYYSNISYNTGYNFINNNAGIALGTHYNSYLYLNNGYSTYASTGGSFDSPGNSTYINCNNPVGYSGDLEANFNQWQGSLSNYNLFKNCNPNQSIKVADDHQINTSDQSYYINRTTYCGSGGVNSGKTNLGDIMPENPFLVSSSGALMNTTLFNNKTISQAFVTSLAKLQGKDSTIDYLNAFDYFIDIIVNHSDSNLSSIERVLIRNSYEKLVSCLGGAIRKKQVSVSRNATQLHAKVQQVINLQNNLIQKTITDSTWQSMVFTLHFDKALTYYMAEKRTKSLQVLDSILIWLTDTHKISVVNNWKCFINGQIQLINKTIKYDSLGYYYPCYRSSGRATAINQSQNHQFQITGDGGFNEYINYLKNSNSLNVYPNPAGNEINIQFNSVDDEKRTIELYDGKGSLVNSETRMINGSVPVKMDISFLSTGIFYVKIIGKEKTFGVRFIKE